MMAFYSTIFTSFLNMGCMYHMLSIDASSKWMESKRHVLLGVTGSVAAIKVPALVEALTELSNIKVCHY